MTTNRNGRAGNEVVGESKGSGAAELSSSAAAPAEIGEPNRALDSGSRSGDSSVATNTCSASQLSQKERLAYSIQESADLLGVNYFSVYRLIQRNRLKACRALRGKLLIPRSELLRLLKDD